MSPPFKKRRVDDGTTTSKSKSKSKSNPRPRGGGEALEKIRAAREELVDFVGTVGRLPLMPSGRFAMLLPRHVVDLYAALFQIERLDDLAGDTDLSKYIL